jgi:hypothetical protein
MNQVVIECVWYRSKRDFNKFLKSIEDPKAVIIDYLIIKNKLIKADPYREEPNDSIIALHIINQIKSIFLEEKETPTTIVYTFRNLSCDIISNFKDLIDSNTEQPYTFALNVLKMKKTPSRAILNKFDLIKFIDND